MCLLCSLYVCLIIMCGVVSGDAVHDSPAVDNAESVKKRPKRVRRQASELVEGAAPVGMQPTPPVIYRAQHSLAPCVADLAVPPSVAALCPSRPSPGMAAIAQSSFVCCRDGRCCCMGCTVACPIMLDTIPPPHQVPQIQMGALPVDTGLPQAEAG